MILVIGFLCCAAMLKFLAIFNTTKWIGANGSHYRRAVARKWPLTGGAGESLLDEHFGDFLPFGVKDYRLRRYIRNMRNDNVLSRMLRQLLGIVQNVFELQYTALLTSAFLIIGARIPESIALAPRDVFAAVGAATGIVVIVDIIFLAVLAFTSYAVLGSYGVMFYNDELSRPGLRSSGNSPRRRQGDGNLILTEIYAYAGMLIIAYVTISATTYFISMQLGGFDLLNDKVGPGPIDAKRLFDSFYWTMTMAVGSGDAGPSSILAKIITMIGIITALSLFVIVLAGLAGITVATPEQPRRRHSHRRKIGPARSELQTLGRNETNNQRTPNRQINNRVKYRQKKLHATTSRRRRVRTW